VDVLGRPHSCHHLGLGPASGGCTLSMFLISFKHYLILCHPIFLRGEVLQQKYQDSVSALSLAEGRSPGYSSQRPLSMAQHQMGNSIGTTGQSPNVAKHGTAQRWLDVWLGAERRWHLLDVS
jgi:hypothetical protein